MNKKLMTLFIGLAVLLSTSGIYAADYDLRFTINRSAVPALYFKDLTLKVNGCGATGASVKVDNKAIASSLVNGMVVFTTAGTDVVVSLANAASTTNMGQFSKAALKNDKKWAWSHSVDDNYDQSMDDEVAAFKAKGYAGTLYMCGNQFSWLTAPVLHWNDGWTIGNHAFSHDQDAAYTDSQEVVMGDAAIYSQLANIGVTNFIITVFANPFFDGKWNTIVPPLYAAGKTKIVMLETGGASKYIVDPGAAAFSGWSPVSYAVPVVIGRENGFGNVRANADFMHTNASDTRHFWYNSFSHGNEDNGTASSAAVNYIYDNYNAEAWVAPVDAIYGYQLVREKSTVSYLGSSQDSSGLAVASVVAAPDSICNETANAVTFSAQVSIVKGVVSTVTADLTAMGGGAAVAMTHGAGNTYTCSFTVPAVTPAGAKTFSVTATANSGAVRTANGSLKIGNGALRTLDVYTDNATLGAAIGWGGDGGTGTSKATEISTGAYEGTKCMDFAYTIGAYWAGFGFNFGGTTLNATGYDTLLIAHKGLDPSLNFSISLKSATAEPKIATISGAANWTQVKIAIPGGTPVSAIAEINIVVGGAQTSPAGHLYIDKIQLIGHGLPSDVRGAGPAQYSFMSNGLHAWALGGQALAVETNRAGAVSVFDLRGNRVAFLNTGSVQSIRIPAAQGTYLVRFACAGTVETQKILVR